MEKSKLKKIAIMGMASGMMLAAPAIVSAEGAQLAGGCGAGKCGGQRPNQTPTSRSSCGGQRPSSSCGGQQRPSHSCGGAASRNYTADADMMDQRAMAPSMTMMSETELLKSLNAEGKATYQSLDAQGKALALKLASSDTYKDKNQAVKEAAKKAAERRAGASH